MTPDKELKPCKICGGQVRINKYANPKPWVNILGDERPTLPFVSIQCERHNGVLVNVRSSADTIEEAVLKGIEQWNAYNTRADQSPPLPDDVREAAEVLQPLVDAWEFSSEITFAIKTLIRAATQQPEVVTVEEFKRRVNLYINKNYPFHWGTAVMKEFPNGVKIVEG